MIRARIAYTAFLYLVFFTMTYLATIVLDSLGELYRNELFPQTGIEFTIDSSESIGQDFIDAVNAVSEPVLLVRSFSSTADLAWISNRPAAHWFRIEEAAAQPTAGSTRTLSGAGASAAYLFTARLRVIERLGLDTGPYYFHHVSFGPGGFIVYSPNLRLTPESKLLPLESFISGRETFPLAGRFRIVSEDPARSIEEFTTSLRQRYRVSIDTGPTDEWFGRAQLAEILLFVMTFLAILGANVYLLLDFWSIGRLKALSVHSLCGATEGRIFVLGLGSFSTLVLSAGFAAVLIRFITGWTRFLRDPQLFTASILIAVTATFGIGLVFFLPALIGMSKKALADSLRPR